MTEADHPVLAVVYEIVGATTARDATTAQIKALLPVAQRALLELRLDSLARTPETLGKGDRKYNLQSGGVTLGRVFARDQGYHDAPLAEGWSDLLLNLSSLAQTGGAHTGGEPVLDTTALREKLGLGQAVFEETLLSLRDHGLVRVPDVRHPELCVLTDRGAAAGAVLAAARREVVI